MSTRATAVDYIQLTRSDYYSPDGEGGGDSSGDTEILLDIAPIQPLDLPIEVDGNNLIRLSPLSAGFATASIEIISHGTKLSLPVAPIAFGEPNISVTLSTKPTIKTGDTIYLSTASINMVTPSEAVIEVGVNDPIRVDVSDTLGFFGGLQTMWGGSITSQLLLGADLSAQHGILVSDLIKTDDVAPSGKWAGSVAALSCFDFKDFVYKIRTAVAEVQETLDLYALTSTQLIALVREALRVRETIVPSAHFAIGAFDSVLLADKAVCSWVATLLETLGMQVAAPVVQFSREAVDAFLFSDTAGVTAFGQSAITDHLGMQDTAPLAQWLEAVNEALESGDAVSVQSIFFRHIADPMELSDAGNTSLFSSRGVADQLAVSDRAGVALLALAQSVLDLAGGSAAIFRAVKAVDESLELSDEGVIVRKSYLAAQDLLALGDLMAANGSYSVSVQDSFRIDVHLVFAGEDGEVWECYVLNTSNFQPSVYTGFSFNSFCTFEGRTFGAGRDGIYEIAGSTDDGEEIPTGAVLSQTNFAIPNRKRFRRAYLGVSGDTPVMAMATEDGTGIIYEITEDQTVNATRAMVGKKWTLTVADFDQLDFISLVPVILARGR